MSGLRQAPDAPDILPTFEPIPQMVEQPESVPRQQENIVVDNNEDDAPHMSEEIHAQPSEDVDPGMDIEAVYECPDRRGRSGPLISGVDRWRKRKESVINHTTVVSCKGPAPAPDDGKPTGTTRSSRRRQPVKPKHPDFGMMSGEWTADDCATVSVLQDEILQMMTTIGVDTRKYRKQVKPNTKVAEVYSAPRVTHAAKMLPELGIAPGYALDLSTVDENGTPRDFDRADMREKARKMQREEEPMLLIGSPMCTEFSALLNLSAAKRDPVVVAGKLKRARNHLAFCCEMYEYQVAHGRYFLHEHPLTATSWYEPTIMKTSR